MSSYLFVGWVEDDAAKVLRAHFRDELKNINFKSEDRTKMAENVVEVQKVIKKSKLKGFKFDILFENTDPIYILYLGKLVKNTCDSNENTSIMEIPINIVDSYLKYVKLIDDKKINRTKHPRLCNIVGQVGQTNTPSATKQPKPEVDEPKLDSDDDIEKTENLAKIAKPRAKPRAKNGGQGKKQQKNDEESEIDMDDLKPEKKSRVPKSEINGLNSDETFEDNLDTGDSEDTEDIGDARTKQVTFEDLEDDVTEEKDEFLDSESGSSQKSKSTPKNAKNAKDKKSGDEQPKDEKPKSRRQRRKELEDDGEESRWEPL